LASLFGRTTPKRQLSNLNQSHSLIHTKVHSVLIVCHFHDSGSDIRKMSIPRTPRKDFVYKRGSRHLKPSSSAKLKLSLVCAPPDPSAKDNSWCALNFLHLKPLLAQSALADINNWSRTRDQQWQNRTSTASRLKTWRANAFFFNDRSGFSSISFYIIIEWEDE
jgi:hypothetical protein